MTYGVTTNIAKEKIIKARAGIKNLPAIKYIAFGDGGVGSGGVIEATPTQTMLNNEITRKEVEKVTIEAYNKCSYICSLTENELVGAELSELALIDEEGDIVAIRNFNTKIKDAEMGLSFQILDEL